MSIPYIPKITTGGQNAAITARENGFAFEVTHVSFGTGLYVHTGNEIALQNEIAKVPIAGGGRVAGMLSLVINTLLKDTDLYVGVNQPVDISEIGFWNEDVLFAIYANNTVLVRKIQDCYIANVYTLALKTLQPIDAANINVVIDEGAAIVLALLGEHLSVTNPHPQYATVLMLQDEALTREQNDLALSIAIAAEITNRENADLDILSKLNNVLFSGDNHTVLLGIGNVITLPPKSTIRVILIGGGGGGGSGGSGGGGYGGAGGVGGDSIIYPVGNMSDFIVKAKGGLGGGAAYGGNGSSYALGNSPDGQDVDINNLYDVVILSYQNGIKSDYSANSSPINHPTVKKLGLTTSGQGKAGTSDGYFAIGGGGSGGAFAECIILNNSNTAVVLNVDCGAGGNGGVGLNLGGTVINGITGNDGVCVYFHQ